MGTETWMSADGSFHLCKPCILHYIDTDSMVANQRPLDMNDASDARHYENEEKGYDMGEEDL